MSAIDRLIDAAKQGDLAEVKVILESHPEIINQRDQKGATPSITLLLGDFVLWFRS